MNSQSTFTVAQGILPAFKETITARSVNEADLSQPLFDRFLSSVSDGKIGLAPTYGPHQKLASIALASRNQVVIVKFSTKTRIPQGRNVLTAQILTNPSLTKVAFHMDKLATSLFFDFSLRINEAVDILSGLPQRRHLLLAKALALGDPSKVDKESVCELFCEDESSGTDISVIALQAWAAYQAGLVQVDKATLCTIDTTNFPPEVCFTISDYAFLSNSHLLSRNLNFWRKLSATLSD